jgi:hypothetical protein
VVNRKDSPAELTFDGYEIVSCTEIETKEYSFESNDYRVREGADATVHGHSVLFARLVPLMQ